jgi:hypothetical protein
MGGRFPKQGFAMAATSDWRLYQLYLEFGEAQDRRGRTGEAADAFALALYYARRMNDSARIHECRQLVLARNPNHVAGQAVSAPLFFAQLLMRYPADEVELALSTGRPQTPSVAVADDVPDVEPRSEDRTFRQARSARPSFDDFAQTVHHHAEPTFEGMPRSTPRPVVADDVLLADAGLLDEGKGDALNKRMSLGDFSTAVKAFAAGSIASGLLLVAYLGYSLYPMLNHIKAERGGFRGDDTIIVTDDDAGRNVERQVVEPPKTPPAVVERAPAPTPIPEAGANMAVRLSSEPATTITSRTSDPGGSSRK